MRITGFYASGYAAFRRPLALDDIGDVTILHGANNSGKSSVLRALELYFHVLGAGESVTRDPVQTMDRTECPFDELLTRSLRRPEPEPIVLRADWRLCPEELAAYSLTSERPIRSVRTEIELRPVNRTLEIRVLKWLHGDRDVAQMTRDREPAETQLGAQLRRLLADAFPYRYDRPVFPIRYAGAMGGGLPASLCDGLFDSRQARDGKRRDAWRRFERLAESLRPELGSGSWDTVFDRASGQAGVVFLSGEEVVDPALLSDGIRRYLALIAELALAEEPVLFYEEPEWRLSPTLQVRFLECLRAVIAKRDRGQCFLTTHSTTLAAGADAREVVIGEDGPELVRRPAESASRLVAPPEPGGDLNGLIGLVEELAELEPEELVEAAVGRAVEADVGRRGSDPGLRHR
jgi:predicted ATPase